ncbi:hypothetical protein QYE76_046234 [Lolium multiflorum]|uniref:Uncharacterized protein n=1 Tax=Lolium multiflorum TaxID=4521 RepID=A0AAD8TMZ6_LOLMU|nr:hypothetical protein QYE76_046234 [Lolium multiflorum]
MPLSNLDLLLPPLDVSVFFCYLHPAPMAAALKEALAKVLVKYYPLAGEVVANTAGEPELLTTGKSGAAAATSPMPHGNVSSHGKVPQTRTAKKP